MECEENAGEDGAVGLAQGPHWTAFADLQGTMAPHLEGANPHHTQAVSSSDLAVAAEVGSARGEGIDDTVGETTALVPEGVPPDIEGAQGFRAAGDEAAADEDVSAGRAGAGQCNHAGVRAGELTESLPGNASAGRRSDGATAADDPPGAARGMAPAARGTFGEDTGSAAELLRASAAQLAPDTDDLAPVAKGAAPKREAADELERTPGLTVASVQARAVVFRATSACVSRRTVAPWPAGHADPPGAARGLAPGALDAYAEARGPASQTLGAFAAPAAPIAADEASSSATDVAVAAPCAAGEGPSIGRCVAAWRFHARTAGVDVATWHRGLAVVGSCGEEAVEQEGRRRQRLALVASQADRLVQAERERQRWC